MSKIVINEHKFKADSWADFPRIVTLKLSKNARVLEMRNSGCDVSLFVEEIVDAAKEDREFSLYRLGESFDIPSPFEHRMIGIAGEALNKCVVYERCNQLENVRLS